MENQKNKKGQVIWLAGLPLVLHYSVNSLCAMEARYNGPHVKTSNEDLMVNNRS